MAATSFPFSQNHQPLLNRFEPVDSKTNTPGWLRVNILLSPDGSTAPDVLTLAPLHPVPPRGRAGVNTIQPSPLLN